MKYKKQVVEKLLFFNKIVYYYILYIKQLKMALAETGTKIVITTVGISGLALPIYGWNVLLLLMIIYFIIIMFDTLTGYFAARKQKKVLSFTYLHGLGYKFLVFGLICLLTILAMSIGMFVDSSIGLYVGLIPHFALAMLIFGEFISIMENFTVLFEGQKEGRIFGVVNYLTNKIFNIGVEKLKEYGEEKIENKFVNNKNGN